MPVPIRGAPALPRHSPRDVATLAPDRTGGPRVLDLPYTGYFEPPFEVQVPDHPHGHQVRVWLPPSYRHTEARFPVLWVTDNLLEHAVSAVTASHFTEAPE